MSPHWNTGMLCLCLLTLDPSLSELHGTYFRGSLPNVQLGGGKLCYLFHRSASCFWQLRKAQGVRHAEWKRCLLEFGIFLAASEPQPPTSPPAFAICGASKCAVVELQNKWFDVSKIVTKRWWLSHALCRSALEKWAGMPFCFITSHLKAVESCCIMIAATSQQRAHSLRQQAILIMLPLNVGTSLSSTQWFLSEDRTPVLSWTRCSWGGRVH